MIRFDVLGRLPAGLKQADLTRIGRVVSKALRVHGSVEASLRFVGEGEMMKLNTRYMGCRRPTDVLSFPASQSSLFREPRTVASWGDIVVCPAYAAREARRRGIGTREELVRLIVHGLLHVRGFDHRNTREELRMFGLQERLVERVIEP